MPAALRLGCASANYQAQYSNGQTWCIPGQRPRGPPPCPADCIPTRAVHLPCPERLATTRAPRRPHSPPSRSSAKLRRLAPRRPAPPRTLLTVRELSPSWPASVPRSRTYDTCGPPRQRTPSASALRAGLDRSCPPSSRKWPPESAVRRRGVPQAGSSRTTPASRALGSRWRCTRWRSSATPARVALRHSVRARSSPLPQPVHHFLVRLEL